VLKPGAAKRDVIVGLGQFLDIMKTRLDRIGIDLNNPTLEEFKQYASIFGVVLIPRVEDGYAVAGAG
jgi:hypothetical protein